MTEQTWFPLRQEQDAGTAECVGTLETGWGVAHAAAHVSDAPRDPNSPCQWNRWLTIDAIREIAGVLQPDRLINQTHGSTVSDAFPLIEVHLPGAFPRTGFVETLAAAVNAALSGSPQRLERLLPSHPSIERMLQTRDLAKSMPKEPARLYLRFLYLAVLTWAGAYHTLNYGATPRRNAPLPKWRLARVDEYISLRLAQSITLTDLAGEAGLSRTHFAARFRASVGMSPHEYLTMRRIQRAQCLLREPRSTVVDVALSVGFQTQAHFTNVFRRYVGDTPHRWRSARPFEPTCAKNA
jgi:AraC-like DNA-binding protein